jgi:hypothetical protein
VPLDDVQYRLVACRSSIFGDAAILDSGTREIVESYCPNDLGEPFAYERADSDEFSRAESRLQAKRR